MGRGEELNSSPLQREHEAERGKSCYIKTLELNDITHGPPLIMSSAMNQQQEVFHPNS